MLAQSSVLNLNSGFAASNAGRSRTLAIILTITIAGVFWADSRYPVLLKRYHAGTQIPVEVAHRALSMLLAR